MTSKRETVLSALHAALANGAFASVLRDDVLPERMPVDGLLILRDGDPGEPEVTLSPTMYHYEHAAEVEVFVQDGTNRAALFDALLVGISNVLDADRTLGGACDWAEAEAPSSEDLPVDGAATIKAATVTIVLHYSTAHPLN